MSKSSGFKIEDGVLRRYTGAGGDVVIPEGVTAIDNWAFDGCESLISVTIPEGVTSIGAEAFRWCNSLSSVTIPESITSIGNGAFFECGNLKSVAIPEGFANIGVWAFHGCAGLQDAQGLVIVGGMLCGCAKDAVSVTIPECVTRIDDMAFSGCDSLKSVTIPECVTSIGKEAFGYCRNLTSVTFPEGVTGIGSRASDGCKSLKSVTIPESVMSIGNGAFAYCGSLKSVTIPEGVTSIGGEAFHGCRSLTSVTIPESVTSIGIGAFYGCGSLKSVTIPESVTSIGYEAFFGCGSLTSVTIPESVTSIGEGAFDGCSSLTSVTIPESVTSIGGGAFHGCAGLQDAQGFIIVGDVLYGCAKDDAIVTIPEGVTSISARAFYRCSSLRSVTFPKSVTSIGDSAFAECGDLKVHFGNPRVKFGEKVFGYILFNRILSDLSAAELAGIILFQPVKICRYLGVQAEIDAGNADEVANQMIELLKGGSKEAKAGTRAVDHVLEYLSSIKRETLQALAKVLEEKKYKTALEKLRNDPAAGGLLSSRQESKNPIEEIVHDNWVFNDTVKALQRVIKSGIPYAGSDDVSTAQAVILVCAAYDTAQERKQSFNPVADQVAEALDRAALLKLLEQLVYENSARRCLGALARYGGEGEAARLISEMPKLRKKWGNDIQRLMLLSDTKAAIIYVEGKDWLKNYAAMRGMDPEAVWNEKLLDFGLDNDGKKIYDLGSKNVTASIGPNLNVVLYDETAGKPVRSLPKKGADPDKFSAAAADLADVRKIIKKVARARSDTLLRMFLRGERQDAEKWAPLYMSNPILRGLARLVVWQQDGTTFTLGASGLIRSDGSDYVLSGKPILVAHPMEMKPAEIVAWQQYFVSNGLKQPFEQVWEPVIDPATIRPDRYKGCTVLDTSFMNKKKHGIDRSFYLDDDYEHQFELYLTGCKLERSPSDVADESVLGEFHFDEYTRQVNHIVALLDRWTTVGRILKDDVSVREVLSGFTAAQIMEFIRLATENNCPNCTAMLLDYKQQRFPDIDPLAEFTLEE